ncbi:MAG: sulfatase family protein [Pirellulaceae bacterium]
MTCREQNVLLLGLLGAGLAFMESVVFAADTPAKKPNIIIFLADDLGYGELGMQGNKEIPTPHIDSIAKAGVRFTSGYVSGPYCSPTRAGLMTGRYQTRFGHEFNEGAATPGGSPFGLPLTEKTIANRFKEMGYATCAIGKWHLGRQPEFFPMHRGFDEFFGTVANSSFLNPQNFIDSRKGGQVTPIKDDTFYTTDAYRERAVDWIEKHKDQPYLLYLPFNAQHAPLQATEKYLARHAGIADEKRRIFAAMMSAMDDAIGAVLQKVRDLGQEENTLIFFLADNGGPTSQTTSKNTPLRGNKATTWEGGVRVPFAAQWKGHIPAGRTFDQPIIQLDILPTAISAAGGKIDPEWKLDGVNLLPHLTGEVDGNLGRLKPPHEALYWRFGQQWAVRHGDWKLVVSNEPMNAARKDKPASLFNLAEDISESKDLAADQPEKVKELRALWEKWNAELQPPRWLPVPAAQKGKAKQKNKDKK